MTYKIQAQLIILSRNRPEFLIKAIQSALDQTLPFRRIIVSENSSKNAIQQALIKEVAVRFANNASVSILATNQDLLPHDHFKFIQQKYIPDDNSLSIVFHDDDELLPAFHSSIIDTFDANKNLAAVSCNAEILDVNQPTDKNLMRTQIGFTMVQSKHQFFNYYLNFNAIAPPPFPAYCYLSHLLKKIDFSSTYGSKYSDVAGLSQILENGPMMWLHTPLMKYRLHPLQDSKKNDIYGRRLLARYVSAQCGNNETRVMRAAYRVKYLIPNLTLSQLFSYRGRKIIKYTITIALTQMVSSANFYKFLIAMIAKKMRVF